MTRKLAVIVCTLALCALRADPADAAGKKLVFASPGIPPIFADVVILVADGGGFFKKYGADVEVRQFDSGTAGARAVVAGDADFDFAPTALVINQISNAKVDLVALYGLPNPDFVLATTDPAKASCKDVVGQPVGVDTPGGQRSIMLNEMLLACGEKLGEVQQVALGSNSAAAMIAGQISFAVLHIDDVADVEAHGKPIKIITTIHKADPDSHNILGIARRDRVAADREGFVRLVAGLIGAARYMQNPANADRVAALAAPTGRDPVAAKAALKGYLANDEWPTTDDGLDRGKLERMIAHEVAIGGIKPGMTPVAYDRLVDRSIWRDAAALVAKTVQK